MPTLKSDVTGCRGLHRKRGELQQAMRVSAETARRGGQAGVAAGRIAATYGFPSK